MRVVMNAISAKRGGIVTYTRNLVQSLGQRGVEAIVAVPHTFPDVSAKGIRLLRVGASDYSSPRRLVWEQTVWRRMVLDFQPDVLFSSANFGLLDSPVPQVLLMREGGLFDPFYLANFAPEQGLRANLLRGWRRRLMLASIRRADRTITPTAALRDLLVQWLPQVGERISVNHYGTLVDTFTPPSRGRTWREDGVLRLLYVSVYYPHKCPGVLAQAVELLHDRGIPVHATITMSPEDIETMHGGLLDAYFVRRAADRGLLTLGAVAYADLPAVYSRHDMFVFPAVAETFGHPMAEAMATGLPAVVADTAVNREVCGPTVRLFTSLSPSDLCRRILELDADPAAAAAMGAQGRQRAETLLRWDDHVDRLIAILRETAMERRGRLRC